MDPQLLVLPRQDPEWIRAYEASAADSDNLELWEALIEVTERLQMRATRIIQSKFANVENPEFPEIYSAIKETTRQTYEAFLDKFVLLFGYWIKLAELEMGFAKELGDNKGGNTRKVFAKAVASFPHSVELWTAYVTHLIEIEKEDLDEVRQVLRRGADRVGRDFLSHTFWDKYLEFEENNGGDVIEVLAQIVQIPLHQYARYYEKFLAVISRFDGSVEKLIEMAPLPDGQKGTDVHTHFGWVFQRTQQGTTDRWIFESKISRSYFHVLELEENQIQNWHDYLTWEEANGSPEQVRALYERTLVPAALYDVFWLRYVRWSIKNSSPEDVRNIFRRASTSFVPIARPFIRYQYALYEEMQGDIVSARDIFNAVQQLIPEQEEPYIYRVDFEKRVNGIEAAISYTDFLLTNVSKSYKIVPPVEEVTVTSPSVKALLLATQAKLYVQLNNSVKARGIFKQNANKCLFSKYFWISYFEFEINEALALLRDPAKQINFQTQVQTYVHPLWSTMIATKSHLPPYLIDDLSRIYSDFLTSAGPASPWSIRTAFYDVNVEVNGPLVKRSRLLTKLADYGNSPAASIQRLKFENGHPGVEINPMKIKQGQDNNEQHFFGKYYSAQNGLSTY